MTTKEQSVDNGPSAELRTFYAKYTEREVTTCEAARTAYGTLLPKLKAAHAVFAGKGREGQFKKWCSLAKVNYNSALAMISRDNRSRNNVKPSGQGKQSKWTATFTKAQHEHWDKGVRRVMQACNLDREAAMLYILDGFVKHWQEPTPAPATDAAQPSPAKAKGKAKTEETAKTGVAA